MHRLVLPALVWSLSAVHCSAQTPRAAFDGNVVRPDGTLNLNQLWSRGRVEGKGPVRYTHAPLKVEKIERIVPYGMMVGGHVCPIDHQYYFPKPLPITGEHFDVFAPADGFIVMVGHRTQLTGSSERKREYDDYALHIEHSATVYTFYDLLTSLASKILEQLDPATRDRYANKQTGPATHVRIPVKAGQVVGKVGGRSLDIATINTDVLLPGFLSPKRYDHYAWRVHVVDPFSYFDEPLKSQLLALNPRKAEPRGGRIDFDVDGRLIGNWFGEGTSYSNNRDPRGYWMGHLAIVPHHIDPSTIMVSIGDFDGRPRQFAVRGNGPDPAKVSAKDGAVKYELIYATMNNSGTRIELPPEMQGVQGVLLVQLVEDRKVRIETFPGKTAAAVSGFTSEAKFYER